MMIHGKKLFCQAALALLKLDRARNLDWSCAVLGLRRMGRQGAPEIPACLRFELMAALALGDLS